MLKRFLTGLVSILLIAGCARGVEPALSTSNSLYSSRSKNVQLYPLQAGWKWIYETRQRVDDDPETPAANHEFRITKCEEQNGKTVAVMERFFGNFQPPATAIERTSEGVVLSRYGHPDDGSLTVLKFPLEPGKTWAGRKWQQAEEWISFVGNERIQVPAGTFQSAHLEHQIRYENGRVDRLHYWYAPGVGLVKAIEGLTVDLGQGARYREVTTDLIEYGV